MVDITEFKEFLLPVLYFDLYGSVGYSKMELDLLDRLSRCQDLSNSTELDASELKLEAIPKSVLCLKTLRTLNLRRNGLTVLTPDLVDHLSRLEILNLSDNQLSTLPTDIGMLSCLRKLYIHSNKLTGLPDSINGMGRLEELYVQHNCLTSLPDTMVELKHLSTLNVATNNLDRLPIKMADLTSLKVVDLSGNPLSFVPENIRRLHDKYTVLHSRTRRRELISRALRVRKVVEQRRNHPGANNLL